MKWRGCFLFFLLSFYFITVARGQLITFSVKNERLEKVFLLIEQQSDHHFIYTTEQIEKAKPVTLSVSNEQLSSVLDKCFSGQPLLYNINEKNITVKEKKVVASERPLRGKIMDQNGNPVRGVTINIKGTLLVVASDSNGEFGFDNAPLNVTLILTSVEIEPLERYVGNQESVEILVSIKVGVLDETIVKGYYSTTRQLNTGTVGKLSSKDISSQPVSNPLATLQGRISGLLVTQSNGLPGASFQVLIRGRNSIQNGNDPLYVIDGVIFSSDNLAQRSGINVNSPFNTIVPGDIESIEVLKDADATSLYGSRGANGVILITTKKGKAGDSKLEATLSSGWGKAGRTMKYMNTQQYLSMRREAFANESMTPSLSDAGDLLAWDTTRYTDWKKEMIGHTARQTNLQLRYSGGTPLTTFSISTNYYRESTVFPGDFKDQRFSASSSVGTRTRDNKLHFFFSSSYNLELNRLLNQDLSSALLLPPNAPSVYDEYGKLNWTENGIHYSNPMAATLRTYASDIDRFTGNTWTSYQLFSKLLLKASAGLNRVTITEKGLTPIASQNPAFNPKGTANFANNALQSWIVEIQGEYSERLGNDVQLKALFGSSWQHSRTEGKAVSGTGYVSDIQLNSINGAASISNADNYSKYRYHGLFGRLEISHAEKYVINLTGRRDGSSRFGPGRQYANFGAAGAAWVFSNEKWFKRLNKVISFGKLRGSVGITGNDQIGNYQYFDTYSLTQYPFQGQPSLRPTRLFNPDYGWEQKRNVEFALEAGFFQNNISFTVNWFQSRSGNQIIQYTIPSQTGFTTIIQNFPGLVQNKGWEIELSSRNVSSTHFNWNTSFNLTVASNKLLAFPGLATSSYSNSYVIGEPLAIRKLYEYKGVDPQTGLYSFTDFNRNGIIQQDDRQILKHTNPSFYGGLQNNFVIGKFEAGFFFQFVKQNGIEPIFASFNPSGFNVNEPIMVLDRWRKPGDVARYQRYTATYGDAFNTASLVANSSAVITDASFIRLKNIFASYTVSAKTLQHLRISSVKIFVQGQNLATITRYKGPDPENQSVTAIPPLRMLTGGIHLIF